MTRLRRGTHLHAASPAAFQLRRCRTRRVLCGSKQPAAAGCTAESEPAYVTSRSQRKQLNQQSESAQDLCSFSGTTVSNTCCSPTALCSCAPAVARTPHTGRYATFVTSMYILALTEEHTWIGVTGGTCVRSWPWGSPSPAMPGSAGSSSHAICPTQGDHTCVALTQRSKLASREWTFPERIPSIGPYTNL